MMQTATPGDQAVNSAMVLTQAVEYLAERIDQILTPDMSTSAATYQLADYMYMLFMALLTVAVFTLIWETFNVVLDAGSGNSAQEFGWRRLFDTGLVKRWLRFLLLATLGSAIFIYEYRPDPDFYILRVSQTAFRDAVNSIASPLANWVSPIDRVRSVANTIKQSSETLGAYYFSLTAQQAAAQQAATTAAEQVWNDNHPAGSTPVVPPGQQTEAWTTGNAALNLMSPGQSSGDVQAQSNQNSSDSLIVMAIKWVSSAVVNAGVSTFILLMNLGLDVMIVRCLMFNAIYMMIAYKVAFMILPIACVAAFWNHWESILRGVIQVIVIMVISLNILTDLTGLVVGPAGVQDLATSASTQAQSAAPDAATTKYAQKVYAQMNAGTLAGSVTHDAYIKQVTNEIGDPTNAYVFNFDALFWAPIRVILMMTIMVTLIGKIATVIGDTISGTMTYHRG